mmetsp:Transcript_21059/g.62710  ORF Transcript_21059/g.62710 Transcript_21059/m.62710 type:complete len:302 (+) Transcript_21059:299-1204(+)
MCFSKEMSLSFAMLGLGMSYWIYHRTNNLQLAIGVFYFFLMEFLQFFQYLVIGDCESEWNKVLTVLGFLHICFQPYFTHIINSALTKSPRVLWMYVPVLRLCLIGGTLLFLRWVATLYDQWGEREHFTDGRRSTEWLRGEELCTIHGKYHLAWSVPMVDVTYWVPGSSIHSFLMFAPFFVIKPNMVIQGFFLWLSGPYLAACITDNLQEQASIWCFFSIAQIGFMLYIIRDVLILHWGRASKDGDSAFIGATNGEAAHIDLRFIWPMAVIDPAKQVAVEEKGDAGLESPRRQSARLAKKRK